jgi:putative transposase
VLEWQKRPLEPVYPILYLDAIIVKVRDGHQVQHRAAHIAVGVDMEGIKHVLGIWVEATEGAKFRAGVCAELAHRGIRDVLIATHPHQRPHRRHGGPATGTDLPGGGVRAVFAT